ncbi:hypothetical protein D3C76_1388680 [compost metagenome]
MVPLVKCNSEGLSAVVGAMMKLSSASASIACRFKVWCGSVSPWGTPWSNTCRSSGNPARMLSTLRRYSAALVTRTLPSPSTRRVAMGSGPNAENSGQTTQPCFRPPSTLR